MQVTEFTEDNLALALSNVYTPVAAIKTKFHYGYFKEYLGNGLAAKRIVIEEGYVSKDFLQDYSSYYAFCYESYPKICKRIHFFANEFNTTELEDSLVQNVQDSKDFFDHYLGFTVVKPIPITIIGYSLLKNYPCGEEFNERNFWGCRNYSIHFFGREIKMNSLAFQEQDSVLAACATTAIWSMLNKAAADYHTVLKSPSEITKDADIVSSNGSRLFPNKDGLNIQQICQAILNSGLVSEVKQPNCEVDGDLRLTNSYLKRILNAYSALGIPLILVVNVPSGEGFGLHAITVSGYKISPPAIIPPKDEISWLADNIDRFYAHDDQFGPFVKIGFGQDETIISRWSEVHPENFPTICKSVIVPLFPKVRISYEDIEVMVLAFDRILTFFFGTSIIGDLIWDIQLEFSECYKEQIRKAATLTKDKKIGILGKSMPKYLWVVRCFIGEFQVIDFTFDATDVSNGMIGRDIVFYVEDLKPILHSHMDLNKELFLDLFPHPSRNLYYEFLLDRFRGDGAEAVVPLSV